MSVPKFAAARQVAVTGLGVICPLGVGVNHVIKALVAGETGIVGLEDKDYESLPSRVAGLVPRSGSGQYDASEWFSSHTIRTVPRNIQYGLVAARQAINDAGFVPLTEEEKVRCGVAFGCGISGSQGIIDAHMKIQEGKYRRISPYMIPNSLINMTAGMISIEHGFKGPNHSASTACATGAHCISDAFKMVSLGEADVMICGATDACIDPAVVAGFCRIGALSTNYNENPNQASRPFDKDRDGFVIGEGAGALVLEAWDHAVDRGAKIYAKLQGCGLAGDAFHITSPSEEGDGAVRAMQAALIQSGLEPQQVDYINAHATSTPTGDRIELNAIEKLVLDCDSRVFVSSSKGAIGHALGAAGAIEAIFAISAIHDGIIPPTANLVETDIEHTRRIELLDESRNYKVDVALSNSFGFGGTNASLCFMSPHA
eukprot:m.186664 g.186664  ORF g.186664 m.186664 type:complete len:429 (-) comp15593_c0_seq9:1051-2337(-)